ncbi:hypothetical protein Pfo_023276 [Paulownia fortunei]|nr:hypothetical protein Pfo_023276 [Paulownia fortunei]
MQTVGALQQLLIIDANYKKSSLYRFTTAIDTISVNQSLRDPETLISNGKKFKLGFFSPVNGSYRYLGVMYNIPVMTVIWVANRDKPLNDSMGTLEISGDGNLVILDGRNEIAWSSNISNLSTNEKNILTSWRSPSDPALGSFTSTIEPQVIPESFVWKDGYPYWRSGPWNGQIFIGIPGMQSFYKHGLDVVNDHPGRAYATITHIYSPALLYYVLNSTGNLQEKLWSDKKGDWEVKWSSMESECDIYGMCGPFGICNAQDRPICDCFRGFEPKSNDEWNAANWSSGCKRKTPLLCEKNNSVDEKGKPDGFLKMKTVKLPDNHRCFPSSEAKCRSQCLNNCSCIAYAYYTGIGCMLWAESLIDVQKFSNGGADLYIKLAYSELDTCYSRKSMLKNVHGVKLEELPLFKFEMISKATDNFDSINKVGQGGFGPVYKGKLPNGQEIAVKRLARASNQGPEEFMNEVEVISKLQHRNLIRLLGCCVECEEKLLVYEYMPNRSLDAYLFGSHRQEVLDWKKRATIIEGICRGLLYLHRDSRLRIIHRDLKASNILLDEELNPKISDFGMARIFGGKEDQANTTRVVGTYGYMAPEYALRGIFSEKSDVYSFGVLLLEIVSGMRNTSSYHDEQAPFLTAYAWKLWNEEKIVNLMDPVIYDPQMETDILRYVNIGLLCVQEIATDRPNVSTVLSMLNCEIVELPRPKQPAFIVNQRSSETERSQKNPSKCSLNDVTMTVLEGRHHRNSYSMLQVFLLACSYFLGFTTAIDTIRVNESVRDPETLVSNGGKFKLGFFSPVNSSYRYVGVMYNVPVMTVIWVANRDRPLNDSTGTLEISGDGNLVILDGRKEIVWSSNLSRYVANSSAVLLDTGNLVLQDNSNNRYVWESFRHASDSFVEKMKILTDLSTNEKNILTSWRSPSDPALGSFTSTIEPQGIPESFIWKDGYPYWRSGPWNGQIFIGLPYMNSFHNGGLDLVNDYPGTAYLTLTHLNSSVLLYYVLNTSGILQEKVWSDEKGDWVVTWSSLGNECDIYGRCGPFGSCNTQDKPICTCFPGFEPKINHEWNAANWSSGCTRKTLLQCEKNNSAGDGFLKLDRVKLPYHANWFPTLEAECRSQCLNNCSCIAYAYSAGIGCLLWAGNLIDVQKFSNGVADLYIRVAYSELGNKKDRKAIIATTVVLGVITIPLCAYFLRKLLLKYIGGKKQICSTTEETETGYSEETTLKHNVHGVKLEELPLFKFQMLSKATDKFDSINKLGQGGFGPVYKGKLPNGQEIAVKRLARSSNQGLEEFMNEVEVISKLQHRNLVRLLGCCVECEEKMLVYEYMPNGSLDAYLFNSHKQEFLDWQTRVIIIEGICRGLLYLHRDSRLRIIHRDLKASNILLDEELNPKISDFGMARIFGCKEDQANTRRVVGTYGYMPPEYALHGIF